jgi:hypothetical protein
MRGWKSADMRCMNSMCDTFSGPPQSIFMRTARLARAARTVMRAASPTHVGWTRVL